MIDSRPAVMIALSPTGLAPTTATTSPGFVRPLRTPISNPGRQDVGEHHRRLVAHLPALVQRTVRQRHAHVLGLCVVDQVAEDPADTRRALVVEAVRRQLLRQ